MEEYEVREGRINNARTRNGGKSRENTFHFAKKADREITRMTMPMNREMKAKSPIYRGS
jgi:hypothetical protein